MVRTIVRIYRHGPRDIIVGEVSFIRVTSVSKKLKGLKDAMLSAVSRKLSELSSDQTNSNILNFFPLLSNIAFKSSGNNLGSESIIFPDFTLRKYCKRIGSFRVRSTPRNLSTLTRCHPFKGSMRGSSQDNAPVSLFWKI